MVASAIARYQDVKITTGSPGELLMALYDGLFRFLHAGAAALRGGNRNVANHAISRSHAIISELYASLDHRYAEELCNNLEMLYAFCLDSIVEANIKNDASKLDEVIRVLSPVREAFREAVAQVSQSGGNPVLHVAR